MHLAAVQQVADAGGGGDPRAVLGHGGGVVVGPRAQVQRGVRPGRHAAVPRGEQPAGARQVHGEVHAPQASGPRTARAAAGHRRGLDDRGRRLAEEHEAVDQLLEVPDVAHVEPHHEAVLAGDAMALGHLGRLPGERGDLGDHPGGRADAQDHAQLVAERARVDVGVVAADHAGLLQAREPLADRGRGQADAPPQLGQAQPRVELECGDQLRGSWDRAADPKGVRA